MKSKFNFWKQKELIGFMLFILSTIWILFNRYEVLPIGFLISIIIWKTTKCKKIVLIPIFLGFILGTIGTGFYIGIDFVSSDMNLYSNNARMNVFAGGRMGISIPKYFLSDEQKMQNISGFIIYNGNLDIKIIEEINQVTNEFLVAVNNSDLEKAEVVFGSFDFTNADRENLRRILASFYGQYGNIHSVTYLGYERVDLLNKALSENQIAMMYEVTSDTDAFKYWYNIYRKGASGWYLENVQSLNNNTLVKVKNLQSDEQ